MMTIETMEWGGGLEDLLTSDDAEAEALSMWEAEIYELTEDSLLALEEASEDRVSPP